MSIREAMLMVIVVAGAAPSGLAVAADERTSQFYTIVELGTFGGPSSVANGVNEAGQVVGGADTPDGRWRAALWNDGVLIDVGTLPGLVLSEAREINESGQIICWSGNGGFGASSGFLWENGVLTDLGHLTGEFGDTSPFGLNDSGQVVGTSGVSVGVRHAFLWENGTMTDLAEEFGLALGDARDMNSAGDIASGPYILHADGSVTTLPTLGGNITGIFALNDQGDAGGWSERIPGSANVYPFYWSAAGGMVDLGVLTGNIEGTRVTDMNNLGQVTVQPAFLYDSATGTVQDLHDLIPPGSGWTDLTAKGINDAGQIVGSGRIGGQLRGFVMTPPQPIPTVSGWGVVILVVLILIGGTILIRRNQRTAA